MVVLTFTAALSSPYYSFNKRQKTTRKQGTVTINNTVKVVQYPDFAFLWLIMQVCSSVFQWNFIERTEKIEVAI